ncbi:S-layer homology domain-containing protein [Thermoanaerobacterium thermosaccharolyticum]|uniref:S-layer homology domain-containing protein n=1 Tax=Thermoanaerobacterium thermosaccharolyticum TaxID=1517 RepID=UPI002688FD71
MVKKMVLILVLFIFILIPVYAFANDAGYEGGIANEYEYKEVIFLTGSPVVFDGKLTVSQSTRSGTTTATYRYQLTSSDGGKLTRTLTFSTVETPKDQYNQVQSKTTLSRYSETITEGGNIYKLSSYEFNGSDIKSLNPGVNYFAGNFAGRKVYTLNNSKGTITVDITDKTVGFDHAYGNVKTQQINYIITGDTVANNTNISWSGTADVDVSFTVNSDLEYVTNDPNYISFRGGYLLSQTGQDVMKYSYDLPEFDSSGNVIGRNTGSSSASLDEVPQEKRLVVPNVNDINGTWGYDDILKLMSMEIFPNTSKYFGPKLPITRSDFTVAVAKAVNLAPYTAPKTIGYTKNKINEVSPFIDVSTADSDYGYIKAASQAGLVSGTAPNQFSPDKALTRAEAAVIFVRALGLSNLAPSGYFSTGFRDDSSIPSWAKRDIYVANEIGLLEGDGNGNINANDTLTREEAAAMISRMIDFMMKDLSIDYVQKVINY